MEHSILLNQSGIPSTFMLILCNFGIKSAQELNIVILNVIKLHFSPMYKKGDDCSPPLFSVST